VSISSTFHEKAFLYESVLNRFSLIYIISHLVIKDYHKMMVKLTSGVNFINILHKRFLYKSVLLSFSLVMFLLCNFLAKGYWQKSTHKMLMKLNPEVFISLVLSIHSKSCLCCVHF